MLAMVAQMDKEDCATCTNLYECQAACPKGITVVVAEYVRAMHTNCLY
ncbi:MAG: hypothetical protein PUC83_09335 [Fibrobacter sp.]|nr:hypothetical protein [Fibrobacter sp.]MDD5942835.1 hypothetical protein [Fibrobacter sp.]